MSERGFSLIELIFVTALLALIITMVLPAVGNLSSGYSLDAAARDVAATISLARSEAVAGGRRTGIVYWQTEGRYAVLVPVAEEESADLPPRSLFDDGRMIVRPAHLPRGIVFEEVVGPDNRPFSSGEAIVDFDPEGTTGSHIVRLRVEEEDGGLGETISVRFRAIAGLADRGEDLEFEEYRR